MLLALTLTEGCHISDSKDSADYWVPNMGRGGVLSFTDGAILIRLLVTVSYWVVVNRIHKRLYLRFVASLPGEAYASKSQAVFGLRQAVYQDPL